MRRELSGEEFLKFILYLGSFVVGDNFYLSFFFLVYSFVFFPFFELQKSLYNDGFFVQSRNFNLQKVGDTHWIKKNYNFRNISFYIDELLILDISRNTKNKIDFMKSVREISDSCFVPITVGGGVKNVEDASYFLSNGCDKILINSELHNNKEVVSNISKTYGDQSIILSIDFKRIKNNFQIFFNNGQDKSRLDFKEFFEEISTLNFG